MFVYPLQYMAVYGGINSTVGQHYWTIIAIIGIVLFLITYFENPLREKRQFDDKKEKSEMMGVVLESGMATVWVTLISHFRSQS